MRKAKEVWENIESDWLPPFLLYTERLFTFEDLSTSINPLYEAIDTNDIEILLLKNLSMLMVKTLLSGYSIHVFSDTLKHKVYG